MLNEINNAVPIYLKVAEKIEDAILSGAFSEDTQIPSTTEISVHDKINPATALKGVNLLVDSEILYKKRGLGMFVAPGAVDKIKMRRRQEFSETYIRALITEAQKLSLTREEVISLIERGFEDENN
jgi:GntR family transcriptional regulator